MTYVLILMFDDVIHSVAVFKTGPEYKGFVVNFFRNNAAVSDYLKQLLSAQQITGNVEFDFRDTMKVIDIYNATANHKWSVGAYSGDPQYRILKEI